MTPDQSILIQLMRSGGSEVPNEGGHIILSVIVTIYTEVYKYKIYININI